MPKRKQLIARWTRGLQGRVSGVDRTALMELHWFRSHMSRIRRPELKPMKPASFLFIAGCLFVAACSPRDRTGGPAPTATPTQASVAVTSSATPAIPPAMDDPTPTPTATETLTPIARLRPGEALTLDFIQFVSADEGWGVGGIGVSREHVLRTSDGGETWQDVTPPEAAPEEGEAKIAVAYFLDSDQAWVTYYYDEFHRIPDSAVVWASTDGGATWRASAPLDFGSIADFYIPSDLQFLDARSGWLFLHLGAGMQHDFVALMGSSDGGTSWRRLIDPAGLYIQSCPKTGLDMADSLIGWVTRDCGGVVDGAFLDWTFDGGETWEPIELPAPREAPTLFDPPSACSLHFPTLFTPGSGAVVVRCLHFEGDELLTRKFLYATQDGGESWATEAYPGGTLFMFDELRGFAFDRMIRKTSDGGATWEDVKEVSWDGQFSFIDPETGWAVAESEDEVALVRSVDGGVTWQLLEPTIAE